MTQVLDVYEKLSLPVKPVKENHDICKRWINVIQIISYFVEEFDLGLVPSRLGLRFLMFMKSSLYLLWERSIYCRWEADTKSRTVEMLWVNLFWSSASAVRARFRCDLLPKDRSPVRLFLLRNTFFRFRHPHSQFTISGDLRELKETSKNFHVWQLAKSARETFVKELIERFSIWRWNLNKLISLSSLVPLHKQFYKWEKLDACVLASAKRA